VFSKLQEFLGCGFGFGCGAGLGFGALFGFFH